MRPSIRAAALVALAATCTTSALASNYELSEGDVVQVLVFGEQDISREARVGSDCTIELQLLGRMEACNKTPEQLGVDITSGLSTYLLAPRVTVSITEYGGKTIEIKGAVSEPGVVVLEQRTRLSEAISRAGGPVDSSVIQAQLVRGAQVQEVDLLSLARREPIWLEDGDVVVLLPPAQVFVSGEVGEQGPVPFRDGLTVTQALNLAGGMGQFAGRRAFVVRGGDDDKVKLNLRRIQMGLEPDVSMAPDDTLVVRRATF